MENREDLLEHLEPERRDFLKKIAIAAVFAAPTIATFSLDGMRKKAFAQAAYDQPVVTSLTPGAVGTAVVAFSQPMDTGAGVDPARNIISCRQLWFTSTYLYVTGCTWSGNMHQIVTYSGYSPCSRDTLNVTYNQGPCGSRFVGLNELELVPYSGNVSLTNECES